MRNRAAPQRGSSHTAPSRSVRKHVHTSLAFAKVLTASAEARLVLLILLTSVSAGFTACVTDMGIAKQEAREVSRDDRVGPERVPHSDEQPAQPQTGVAVKGRGHGHGFTAPRFLTASLAAARSIGLVTIPLFIVGAILRPVNSSLVGTMRAVGLAVLLKTIIEWCVAASGVLMGRPPAPPLLGSVIPAPATTLVGESIADISLLVPVFALCLAALVARLWRCSPLRSVGLAAVVLIIAVAWSVATGHGHNASVEHYH